MKKLLYIILFVPFTLFGQENYSLNFDNTDWIDLGNYPILTQPQQSSFLVKVKMNQLTGYQDNHTVFFRTSLGGQIDFGYDEENQSFYLAVFINGDDWYKVFCSASLQYHTIIGIYDRINSEIKIYKDGVLSDSMTIPDSDLHQYSHISSLCGNNFNKTPYANVDEVIVWESILSDEIIQNLTNCSNMSEQNDLVGYWNFNEGSGDTVYDISGNGNHGIIHGATYSNDVLENNCDELIEIEDFSYLGSFDGSNYYLSHNANYWEDAHQNCLFLGGDLLTISSIAENNFILESINSSNLNVDDTGFWIGLILINNEWGWISNEILSFVNWDENEPTNPPQNYGQLYTELSSNNDIPGSWDDTGQGLKRYILEISITKACMNPDAINFDETATIDDEESCIYSQEYVHGLWNQVDDGAIEFSDYQEQATTSLSSLQQALDTWNTTIDLSAGWNMFGYGCPTSINVAEGLSNHTESIIITKDNNGAVYMPEFGFNGIGDFTPGFGYQIKVTESIEGFSLCDWYVNDIPEDNIVSLQDSLALINSLIGCTDSIACNFALSHLYDDSSCEYPEEGYDCEGNLLPIYQVGDYAEGGIVFYIDETGEHGLVASIQDEVYTEVWESALYHAEVYNEMGYDDWYLPSINELEIMYLIIGQGSGVNVGGFTDNYYWSSTEINENESFGINFYDGDIHPGEKLTSNYVRAIRSF